MAGFQKPPLGSPFVDVVLGVPFQHPGKSLGGLGLGCSFLSLQGFMALGYGF